MKVRLVGKCPKCGNRECTPTWHHAREWPEECYCCFTRLKSQRTTEHLHYVCTCGYDWTADCLDHIEPTDPMVDATEDLLR